MNLSLWLTDPLNSDDESVGLSSQLCDKNISLSPELPHQIPTEPYNTPSHPHTLTPPQSLTKLLGFPIVSINSTNVGDHTPSPAHTARPGSCTLVNPSILVLQETTSPLHHRLLSGHTFLFSLPKRFLMLERNRD